VTYLHACTLFWIVSVVHFHVKKNTGKDAARKLSVQVCASSALRKREGRERADTAIGESHRNDR